MTALSSRLCGIAVRWAGVLCVLLVVAAGCEKGDSTGGVRDQLPGRASVAEGGATISFPAGSPGLSQIHWEQIRKRSVTIPVVAPARVVASIVAGLSSQDRIVLFESAEVTSLYSQYRQSRSNVDRTGKNLSRIKEMYDNQASTGKDLNDAETEAANAKSSMAEAEGKLRGLGFNPVELERVATGTIWLICDVPESQLHEVQKGEEVDIVFTSFADLPMKGRADAIGEVVDPVTRSVKVRVSTPNPRLRILPGMFARVDFGDPIDNVCVLPTSAIVAVEGTEYAFVETREGTFERRPVTLASSGSRDVVVLKGIADGEHVVIAGAMLLKGLSFGY